VTPLVALVGRPSVGKSTLFNRIVGRRLALVEDVPGVTRDRHYAEAEWAGRSLALVDTGGFVPGEEDALLAGVRAQAKIAVGAADVVVLVVDGRAGPLPADHALAELLRRSGKPVVVAVNKLDQRPGAEAAAAEFYRLGLPEVLPISAEHALGIDALLDAVEARLPAPEPLEVAGQPPDALRVAIIGRPNVGKSTLLNALLGEERVVVGPVPGTTRDPIDAALVHRGRHILLTDTAGMRRKKAGAPRLERTSILAALRRVERAEVVVLVLDATEPGVEQDARLAGMVEERGRALLVLVNKWDLLAGDRRRQGEVREQLQRQLRFVGHAPVLFGSALEARQVRQVLDQAVTLGAQFHFRAATPLLNRLLEKVVGAHPPPSVDGRPLRLYYIAQPTTAPPTFIITCNRPRSVPPSYRRYLMNQLREAFSLRVPLHLLLRERPGAARRAARKRR